MDEKKNDDQNLGKIDDLEIEPLTDEALESVAGGSSTDSTFDPVAGDSCSSCCSCSSCS